MTTKAGSAVTDATAAPADVAERPVLHARGRVRQSVQAGVADYGNKIGLPTVAIIAARADNGV